VAETFTDAYYYALEKERADIPSFYCPKLVSADSTVPFIAWNGEVFHDAAEFQTHYETLTHTHFDLEGLDCNIINKKFLPSSEVQGGGGDDSQDFDRRMSIAVTVMGSIRLEEPLKGPIREFSENFVLVPNRDKLPKPRPTFEKGWHQEWVIQTQNFRFTEWGASEIGGGKTEPGKSDMKMETNGEKRNQFQGRNKGIASQFAAAGLLIKGKGKA
jgi:NTF2-related export protein 1/2